MMAVVDDLSVVGEDKQNVEDALRAQLLEKGKENDEVSSS